MISGFSGRQAFVNPDPDITDDEVYLSEGL